MPFSRRGIKGFVRPLLLMCLMIFLGYSQWHPVAAAQDPKPPDEITIAVGEDYIPFFFRDKSGQAAGWMVDLWKLWSSKTGIKVKFVILPFGETLAYTKDGKVDLQGGCFYSKQRATYLDYVAPLANCDTHFFFHKNIYGIETLKDLMGYRIGVIKGDLAVSYLKEHLPGVSLAQYATSDELFNAFRKGEIRVFVMDTPMALDSLKKLRLLSSVNYYPAKPLYSNAYRAAVKKGNSSLASLVKKGLDMITPEEKAAIERRWMGSAQTKTEGVLTIACDRYYPPFTMLTPSGRAAGILVDFWRLWSSKTLRQIEFVFGDWEQSIQMVKEGKADFHSGLLKTPEREAFLSFSIPIFATQNRLAFRTGQEHLGFDGLGGERVGVIAGSAEEAELKNKYREISVIPFAGYRDLLKALQDREIQAVYDVGVTLKRVIEEMSLQGEIEVSEKAGPIQNIHAGILKKHILRLKAINRGIGEITEKEIQDIEARWVPDHDFQLFSGKARPMVLTIEEKEWLKKHPHIKLGVDPGFMPFEAVTKAGKYEGIASSYVALLNDKLRVKMGPVKGLNWSQVIAAAKKGEVDVLPCVAMTEQRTEYLLFTRPYLKFQTVVVTRNDAPAIAGLNGLLDDKVAVAKDYYIHELLKRDFPEMELLLVKNIEEGLMAVDEGKAAAYVDNSASVIFNLRKLGLINLKIAATTKYDSSLRFGVRKDWPEFVTILDKALGSIPETEREKMADHWINVRFAQRTDWDFLIKTGIAVAVVIGLIVGVILIWNRRLSREAAERRRAEEQFQAIAAATPGAIIQLRFDDEHRPEYQYLSPRAEAFFGMPPEQVIAEKGRIPWHPEDLGRIEEEARANLLAEADMNHVARIQPKGEEVLWIRLNASPSRNAEGELIYSGFILDITERKQAELEYLKSERKIKAMSQAAEDALIMIDGEGKVLFWNPAAEKLFGYSEAEAMGMDFHQMAAPGVYHDKIYKGLKRFSETGEGAVLGATTEITARNRENAEFPVEVTLSSFQVDDEWFAVGTVRDISERKQAEEMLKESQNRLDMALTASNTGLWDWRPQTGEDYHNDQWFRQLGYEKSDFENEAEALMQLIHPEDKEVFLENMERYSRGGSHEYKSEFRMQAKDGSWKWILSVGQIIERDVDGLPTRIVGVHLDMTERKKSEEALTKSERQVKTILETANEGFFIINNDQEVLDANPTMCGILKRERDAVVGKSIFDFVDDENKKIFHEQVKLRKQGITSAYEIALSLPEGRHVFCIFNSTPLYDENNEKIGAFAMVTDITDRKKSEDRLKSTQTTVDKAALNIFWVDPQNGKFVYANEAACHSLGYTREELMGMHVPEVDVEFNEEKFAGLMAALKAHPQVDTEGVHRTKDGRLLNVALSIVLTQLENREIIAVFARDETEKKQAEEALKESEKRVQTILNAINTGVIIIDPENRTIVDVNPVAAQMIGLPNKEIIGNTCHQFICPKEMHDCPVLDHEQEVENAERVLVTAEGREVPILKTVTRINLSGRTHLLENFIDISERKKVEEAMRQSEKRTRLILNSAGEGIFGVDAEGHVIFINPAALHMLGFDEQALLGKKIHAIIHHTRADGSPYPVETCPMYSAYHSGDENHIDDEVLWRKDGTFFPVEYASRPIIRDDQVAGAVVSFRDITERKEAEKELKVRLEELEQFNKLVVGREIKMIGLKEEVNDLLEQLGRDEKYEIVQ